MALTTATLALFLHILMVIIGLSAAAVLHVALLQLRAADDVAAARSWPRVIAVLETLLPVAGLAILLTGAWTLQASGGEFGWSQGWVITALVGLVAVETADGLVTPRSKTLRRTIAEAPDGPVDIELRRRILDPVLWCVLHGGTAVFLAVVFVMVTKPSGLWSAVVVAAVGALGAASGLPLTRGGRPLVPTQREPTKTVTEPQASPAGKHTEDRWTPPRS